VVGADDELVVVAEDDVLDEESEPLDPDEAESVFAAGLAVDPEASDEVVLPRESLR